MFRRTQDVDTPAGTTARNGRRRLLRAAAALWLGAAPLATRSEPAQRGTASWYGARFHGRRTASGERFDMHALTAAHRSLPFGMLVQVRNLANGREVIVRINDRGPFTRGRVIDLSHAAARQIGMQHGIAQVELRPLTRAEIGADRATDPPPDLPAEPPGRPGAGGPAAP